MIHTFVRILEPCTYIFGSNFVYLQDFCIFLMNFRTLFSVHERTFLR